ncbi:unnamed protein product [Ilex paraguariensis]|uniref:VQ domain-containing protein n=1 Tax=Ilex paraguariensis TaxID=185542 RepID=A0ABC8S6H4_9AQUA
MDSKALSITFLTGESMSSGGRETVKVVIINTQYVDTDAVSFKSVVQRFTGKDSMVGSESSSSTRQIRVRGGVEMSPASDSVISRGLSFKDFDRLLKELPPLDELYRLCADSN